MFRLILALVGLACVLFTSVGYFMKWYTVGRVDGNIVITIFPTKVEEGLKEIKESAADKFDKIGKALTKSSDEKPQPPKEEQTGLGYLFGPVKPQPPQPTGGMPPASLPMPR